MTTRFRWFALMVLIAGVPTAITQGGVMAYQFAGVISEVHDSSGRLGGSIQPGTTEFSGVFTFDSESPDSSPGSTIGRYTGPTFSMAVNVGPYSWVSAGGDGYVQVQNSSLDWFSAGADQATDGSIAVSLGINLTDPTGTVFSSDALPLHSLPLSAFNGGLGIKGQSGSDFDLEGSITSFIIVPEPSTAGLLLISLLAFYRRRNLSAQASSSVWSAERGRQEESEWAAWLGLVHTLRSEGRPKRETKQAKR